MKRFQLIYIACIFIIPIISGVLLEVNDTIKVITLNPALAIILASITYIVFKKTYPLIAPVLVTFGYTVLTLTFVWQGGFKGALYYGAIYAIISFLVVWFIKGIYNRITGDVR